MHTQFKHKFPIQVRFSDIDALNHVNNSYHSQYFDLGRIHYFEEVSGSKILWSDVSVVIVRTEIDFIKPILQGEDIYVATKLMEFGNKSMRTFQILFNRVSGEIKSQCTSILSGFDQTTNKSSIIPNYFKEMFFKYESL